MRRAERQHTPPEPEPDGGLDARISAELAALKRAGAAEQGGTQCDAPRNSGWRPGARWARSEAAVPETAGGGRQAERRGGDDRADVEQRIARMTAHQRPPMREMGRRSEAADHAFKRLPSDDGGAGTGWAGPMVPVRFGGEGVRPTSGQRRDVSAAIARGNDAYAFDGASNVRYLTDDGVESAEGRAPASRAPGPAESVIRHSGNTADPVAASPSPTLSSTSALRDTDDGSRLVRPAEDGEDAHLSPPSPSCPVVSKIRGTGDRSPPAVPARQEGMTGGGAIAARPMHCPQADDVGAGCDRPPGLGSSVRVAHPEGRSAAHHVDDAASVGEQERNTNDHSSARASNDGLRPAPSLRLAVPAIPTSRHPGQEPHPGRAADGRAAGSNGIGERPITGGGAATPGGGSHRAGARIGSNDAGARVRPVEPFFDTGRSTAGVVARACPADGMAAAALPVTAPSHLAVPLVTVQKVGSRVEVAAACPAARALGITPGIALTQVRAANPGIAVRDADPAGDRAALDRLATMLAQRWSPCVSISDADGLFIDLTGVAHLHGGERRMAERIVRLLHRLGYAARVGVADTPGAAWALARYGDTRAGTDARDAVALLPAGHGMSPFGDHPVAALRLDEAATELMRRLGIDRVSQLAALPRAPLARRFGRAVTTRLDQLTGAVAEPVDPVTPEEPVMVEQHFAEPIMTAEPIAHWMAQLIARLAQVLAERGRGARMVALALTRVDGEVQVVRAGFARATRDPAHVLRLLARRIELIDPGFGIEIMALHVTRGEPLGPQTLAGDLEQQVPDLAALVDAINNRIGASRLWRARAVESDVPERSVASTAPLDQAAGAEAALTHDDVRRLDAREAAHPWHPRWPRPARLLRRPEPIDHVMAELPDSYPRRFRWRGQMHQVVCGDGPERITGEWWRRVAERQAVRDYFQVEDEAGQRFWLFRRGDGQRVETGDMTWYIHGTFA